MSEKVIVVRQNAHATPLFEEFFPGWRVMRYGEMKAGSRFSRIVVLNEPETITDADWLYNNLVLGLEHHGKLQFMCGALKGLKTL